MRKSRFTEAQIIGMIKEQEAGLPTVELPQARYASDSGRLVDAHPVWI
jgi:putative transposase